MATSDFLRELSRTGITSRVVDIPFLLKAHEEGIADESTLAPVASLLVGEVSRFWLSPTIRAFIKELDLGRMAVDSGTFIPRLIPPVNLQTEHRRAEKALEDLAARFPAAADDYRPWLGRISLAMEQNEDPRKVKELFTFFEESVRREIHRQDYAEQQFWNGIYAAILDHIDPEHSQWLISAHRFLNGIEGANKPTSTAGDLDSDALRLQLPILSAALIAGFAKESISYDLLQLGEQTTVKVAGEENAFVIDTPEFAGIDVAWAVRELRPADSRLVSLPIGPAQFGHTRWRELTESPLFQAFAAKLVPSSVPFGIAFPKKRPTIDDLERVVKKAFPDKPDGQRIRVRLGGIQRNGSYGVFLSSETMRHRRWAEIASIFLTIVNGKVAAADYIFPGLPSGHALSVVVDEARLDELVAQGTKNATGISFSSAETTDDGSADASQTGEAPLTDETAATIDATTPGGTNAGVVPVPPAKVTR